MIHQETNCEYFELKILYMNSAYQEKTHVELSSNVS